MAVAFPFIEVKIDTSGLEPVAERAPGVIAVVGESDTRRDAAVNTPVHGRDRRRGEREVRRRDHAPRAVARSSRCSRTRGRRRSTASRQRRAATAADYTAALAVARGGRRRDVRLAGQRGGQPRRGSRRTPRRSCSAAEGRTSRACPPRARSGSASPWSTRRRSRTTDVADDHRPRPRPEEQLEPDGADRRPRRRGSRARRAATPRPRRWPRSPASRRTSRWCSRGCAGIQMPIADQYAPGEIKGLSEEEIIPIIDPALIPGESLHFAEGRAFTTEPTCSTSTSSACSTTSTSGSRPGSSAASATRGSRRPG